MLTIRHGPFRPRWGRLAFAVLWFVMFGGLASFTAETTLLNCGAAPSGAVRCAIEETFLFGALRPRVLERSDMVQLTTVLRRGSRGRSDQTDVVIFDRRGSEHVVARRDDPVAATREVERLRAFLDDPSVPTLQIVTTPGWTPWWLGALALLVTGLLVVNALRVAGGVRIEVDRAHDELRAVRTLLFWRGPAIRASLGDVANVVLEHGPILDWLATRGQTPQTGARLAVVDREGRVTSLAPSYYRGDRAHARAFLAMRAALGLPRIEAPATPGRQPPAPSSRRTLGIVAAVFALAIGASFAGNALLVSRANRTQGWFELRAEHRCRFDGTELLPGGVVRQSLDPGDYVVEVWVGGNWERRTVHVRLGEETIFVCRP